jgi:hypothetical protein
MTLPRTNGPRSVIVTTTDFPLCVTRTFVPNGNVRCAAVKSLSLIFIPLAVLIPCLVEYTDARPLSAMEGDVARTLATATYET